MKFSKLALLLCLAATFSSNAQTPNVRVYDPKNPQTFADPKNPTAGPNLLAADLVFNPDPMPVVPPAPANIYRPDFAKDQKAYDEAIAERAKWIQKNIEIRNQTLLNSPYKDFATVGGYNAAAAADPYTIEQKALRDAEINAKSGNTSSGNISTNQSYQALGTSSSSTGSARSTTRLYDPAHPENYLDPRNPGGGPNLLASDLIFNPDPRPAAPIAPTNIYGQNIKADIQAYDNAVAANNAWNQKNIELRYKALSNSAYKDFAVSAGNTGMSNNGQTAAGGASTIQSIAQSSNAASTADTTTSRTKYVVNGVEINSPTYQAGYDPRFDYGGAQYASKGTGITPNQAVADFRANNQDLIASNPDAARLAESREYERAQIERMTPQQRADFDLAQKQPDQEYINVGGSFIKNPNYSPDFETRNNVLYNKAKNSQIAQQNNELVAQTKLAQSAQAEADYQQSREQAMTNSDKTAAQPPQEVSGQQIADSSDFGCAVALCLVKPNEPKCGATMSKFTSLMKRGFSMPSCNKG